MKPRSNRFIAFFLAGAFALGILCSTFALPGQAFASVSGCSSTPGAMAMHDCNYPDTLCGSNSPTDLFSRGTLASSRSGDSLKKTLGLALGAFLVNVSKGLTSAPAKAWNELAPALPAKVSVHLLNSVLNL